MSPRDDDDRERERPSWRELDARRDRSRHTREERREPRTPKAHAESKAAKQAYLKKLDEKLFSGKGSEAAKGADAVREARGTRGFPAACDAYVEKHGFPASADLLLLFLEHDDPDAVLKALNALTSIVAEGGVDRDALVKALRRLKSLTEDSDVEDAAEELLSSLG
jgi:hypothetical protein